MKYDEYTQQVVIAQRNATLAEKKYLDAKEKECEKSESCNRKLAVFLRKQVGVLLRASIAADEIVEDALFDAQYYSKEAIAWRAKNKNKNNGAPTIMGGNQTKGENHEIQNCRKKESSKCICCF